MRTDLFVDLNALAGLQPVRIEVRAGGRPLVFGDLKRGAQRPRRSVELLGLFGGHLAAQQSIGILQADEKTCRDLHLEFVIEGVVANRTVRAGLDVAM